MNQQVVDLKSEADEENREKQNLNVTVEAERSLLRETRSPAEGKFLLQQYCQNSMTLTWKDYKI